jgi:hypothetical protein
MKQIAPECFVFFSKEKCRFGIPESPEEQKHKNETKKKQIQSTLVQFVSFLFVVFPVFSLFV